MDKINFIIERILIGTFVLCFAFVSIYLPIPPKVAEAGGLGGGSTEFTQIANNVELLGVNVAASASAAYDAITSYSSNSMWIKENILDGIAWALAKSIISQMTGSIVNWINSGFSGSPAFVQDLGGFLTNVADQTMGKYIQDLGGPLSFICSPFKLDIQIALDVRYQQARENQPESSCTLTSALGNIEDFMEGDFTQGGWDSWFQIASKPSNTPYGAYLEADSRAKISILNAQNKETKMLDFGGGFLSSKICETVHGAGTTNENCFVSTPGKVIQEALTFQLSTGPQSLIAADEFNEIVVALFAQLTQQAITGAAGLLGLTGGSGYTYPGYTGGSYVTAASAPSIDPAKIGSLITEGLAIETKYRTATLAAQSSLLAYSSNITNTADRRAEALDAYNESVVLLNKINYNISVLNSLNSQYIALGPNPPSTSLQPILNDYSSLRVHSESEVDASIDNWSKLVR